MATPAPKTLADLAKRALVDLRALRIDASPSAEQQASSDEAYRSVYEELSVQGLAYWPLEEIPVAVFRPLVQIVAQEMASSFGKQYSAGDALARIRIVAAKPWSGRTVRATYY